MATSGVLTSSVLKQSKVLDKAIPTSSTRMAKKSSLGSDVLKVEKETAKISAGRGVPVPKLPGGLRNVPRPSKSLSLASSTAAITEPTSSFDSSSSVLTVKSGKSPSNAMKRKTDSKSGNPTMPSRSNPKTPSRIASRVSAQFVPLSKLSSSISPASSISDWSVESVSSVSSSQQISCGSRDSLSKSSSKRVSVEFDTAKSVNCDNKSPFGSATRTSGASPGHGALRASTEMVALPPTSRPSGLRLPSPKIGFFDGAAKSAVRTPKRNVPSDLPKAGNARESSQGSGIKSKLGKVNPEKAVTYDAAKPDSHQTFLNAKPKASISPEPSKADATEEVFDDSRTVKSCVVTGPKSETDPTLEINQEDTKFEDVKDNTDLAVINGNTDISSGAIGSETKSSTYEDVKITHVQEHNIVTELGSISNFEKLTLPREMIKDDDQFKNDEPISYAEGQIDCLVRQVGAIEITVTDEMANGNEDDGLPNPVVVPVSPTSSDKLSCTRIPFSAKDSLCNIGGSFDVSKGTSATMSEGENCQIALSDEDFDGEQLT